jgi:predicted helicase
MDQEKVTNNVKLVQNYIHSIERKLATGDATEHTHRSALEALVESLAEGITATNEPRHIECGAPDFILRKGPVAVGYIEAKDIGKSLDETEKTDQLKRYRDSLTNLILTDYLEFRWYVDGEHRFSARLGTLIKDGKVKRDRDGIRLVVELLDNFLALKAEAVGTPKELALRMARLAHMIRGLIVNAFEKEPESGNLHAQLAAFRDNLIPDLATGQFADMYGQTIVYGLFAARCTHPGEKSFTRQNAAYLLPKTNPFLRKLFNTIAGPELDDRIAWLVDDLAQVLAQADMEAVLKDFGKHSGKEDPVVHFYETFLKEYDKKIREMRGVYYTPEPVVSYIVRSIDHLLKTRFNKPQGLADGKTLILDPAVGTATFLYMVVKEIHQSMLSHGQQGLWNNYVAEKLLPRIFGFELLMAPYAVAHLKLGLLLQETGYEFQSDQRLGIYLTNTLEEAIKHSETLFAQWITEEANAAARIKKDEPIMVVLGNPPYSSSIFEGEWIMGLLEKYKEGLTEKKFDLNREEWKFLRFADWRIEKTGKGIIGFIINNSFLDGVASRILRYSLYSTFNSIYILNLHGSTMASRSVPADVTDENVFAIQQGVTIILMVKTDSAGASEKDCSVKYYELFGTKDEKYKYLESNSIQSTEWETLDVNSPYFYFCPMDYATHDEYNYYPVINEVFIQYSSGIQTKKDKLAIQDDPDTMLKVVKKFADLGSEDAREYFDLGPDTSGWTINSAKKDLQNFGIKQESVIPILYRPFDFRWTYFTGKSSGFLGRPRSEIMSHFINRENLGLITMRQTVGGEYSYFGVSEYPNCHGTFYLGNRGQDYLFPLYLYSAEGEMQFEGGKRRPNLNPEFIKAVQEKLGLKFVEDGRGDLKETFGPEDVFNYAYAVFHSPTYRSRYAEFLKTDFPRLPLTSDKKLFKALATKGAELVALHLMKSPTLNNLITKYPITGSDEVEKVSYDDNNQRVYINKTQYFEGVPPEVWEFHIGGYQVAQKWLKDRKGRALSYDEQSHYQKVIVALRETIRLMAEIDELIPGWPVE